MCSFIHSWRKTHSLALDEEQYLTRGKEERIASTQRPNACPKCGHSPLAKILYGLPNFKDPEFQRASAAGEITIGGCCITGMEPKWQCVNCGQRIWEPYRWADKQALSRFSASYRKKIFEKMMEANGYKKRSDWNQ